MQTSTTQEDVEGCFLEDITSCAGDVRNGVCEGHTKEIFRLAAR